MADGTMPWELWLETWKIHGESQQFRRRLSAAIDTVTDAASRGRSMFGALSGGKDGVAMAGVLHCAGLTSRIRFCHVSTPLNTPGMRECAEATAEKLDLELDVVEPDVDVWALIRSFPKAGSILESPHADTLRKAIASGNMLVAYQYEHGFDGCFSGMRAEESRGRRLNRIVRGSTYMIKVDDTLMCCPLADWKARDVFSMAVRLGLPICDHYRLLNERFGISPESQMSRVDCLLTEEGIAARGSVAHIEVLYPGIWTKLAAMRPELRNWR